MLHTAAFHQGLRCLLRIKQTSGTEKHQNLENSTCDPLKCTLGSPIPIVSICMGKYIRIQRVNDPVGGALFKRECPWSFLKDFNCIVDGT